MTDPAVLGPWVRRFLLEYVVTERNLARNTQRSYRDTLCLLVPFVARHSRKAIDQLAVTDVSADAVRLTVHHTPKHGSWLNQAEIEIGLFSRQCLGTRRIPDLKTLRREAGAWNRDINQRQTRINWTFDRKAARRQFGYKRKGIRRSEN